MKKPNCCFYSKFSKVPSNRGSTLFFWNRSDAPEFENYTWDEFDTPPTSWYVLRFFWFALIVVGGIGAGAAMYGQAMAEKSLTALLLSLIHI